MGTGTRPTLEVHLNGKKQKNDLKKHGIKQK